LLYRYVIVMFSVVSAALFSLIGYLTVPAPGFTIFGGSTLQRHLDRNAKGDEGRRMERSPGDQGVWRNLCRRKLPQRGLGHRTLLIVMFVVI